MRVWTAPKNASDFLSLGDEQCGRVPSCVRPFNAAALIDRFGGRIQIGEPCSKSLTSKLAFCDPVLLDYSPINLRLEPPHSNVSSQSPLPGTPRHWPLRPKRHGRSCLPARPRPAFLAFALSRKHTCESQDPAVPPRRAACCTTAIAPRIKRRRKSRCPIFDVLPNRVLPPVEFCFGVSPSQVAKSRPFVKVEGGGATAAIAAAQIGPMPGIVISRRAVSSVLAISVTRPLNAAMRSASAAR